MRSLNLSKILHDPISVPKSATTGHSISINIFLIMHKEILDTKQLDLLRLLPFARKKGFYMVGGTAIALHL